MRNALILLHRWLALVTSLVIVLLGLTGSALVFEGAIDRALNPALWKVTPSGPMLPIDTIVAHARAALPGTPVTGISLARTPDRAVVAVAGPTSVFVDPFTGRVLGTRARAEFEHSLPRTLHRLHTDLMFGDIGGELIALVTGACVVLVITGIYLWWADKLWRIGWCASWKRVVYDLHHALGIISALVLLVITGSGMVIHYRTLGKWIARIDAVARAAPPIQPAAADQALAISFDSVARVAGAALPGASITMMSFPAKRDQPMAVSMRFPEDRTPGGRSRVFVDSYRGTVLQVISTRDAPTGIRINNAMRSAHTGDVFGKPTEAVWMLAALVLASQAVSGLLMWWNGRGARAALARKRKARPVSDAGSAGA